MHPMVKLTYIKWGDKTYQLSIRDDIKIGNITITLPEIREVHGGGFSGYVWIKNYYIGTVEAPTRQAVIAKVRKRLTMYFKAMGAALDYDVED